MPDLYDIACCFIRRIVAKKHQDIESCLRQVQFLTERSAESVVGKGGLTGEFQFRIHIDFSFLVYFKFELFKNEV